MFQFAKPNSAQENHKLSAISPYDAAAVQAYPPAGTHAAINSATLAMLARLRAVTPLTGWTMAKTSDLSS